MDSTNSSIYHEKQRWEMCALHALNNLYQDEQAFSKQTMDQYCQSLSPGTMLNPHKSLLGLGNYDVNVIMKAVQTKDCEAVWWDRRRNLEMIELSSVLGFILNITSPFQLGIVSVPIKRKHWIAVREIHGVFYNLDSKLSKPLKIGNSQELREYLCRQLQHKGSELLLIMDKQVEESRSWIKD